MSDKSGSSHDEVWKERFGLENRDAPEFYESAAMVADTPHALAIRTALDELGLSGVFCIQGVPTIAIVNMSVYDAERIVNLHGALWNQGLASLLLVTAENVVRVYSLARKPQKKWGQQFDRRCLIKTLNATADALEICNLVYSAESGRFWKEHTDYFRQKERIDKVLLENITKSHKLLNKSLPSDAAQALLIQAMFIAYLEDRKIITPEYIMAATNKVAANFSALLAKRDVQLLKLLFCTLRNDFNGDLFVAPCSFDPQATPPVLDASHLDVLARFREGREEMAGQGQYRFWGYDFRYIPIELVSAVYDRFLGEKEEDRKSQGAYYTPMYLADTVVSQFWDMLTPEVKEKGQFLDPACGSGVFLVRSFQRLCEHWRVKHQSKKIRWPSLLAILRRIHGWDMNEGAVRVAVFSLYVALLEEVDPPDLQALIKNKKVLPELWESTLVKRDFFDTREKDGPSFDVIVGNPPWTSRRGPYRSSVQWCKKNNLPMPDREDAWAFVWKSLHHIRLGGLVAFLLPAMGFLHNIADTSLAARRHLVRTSRILRIINFADLRFQLFDSAIRPSALFLFAPSETTEDYRFEYWAPKADLNLQIRRTITLSSADRVVMNSATAESDVLAFKHRLWMREPDAKLFAYLSRLPKLGELVKEYQDFSRRRVSAAGRWVIGVGYKPYHDSDEDSPLKDHSESTFVGILPDLPIEFFTSVSQVTANLGPAPSKLVHRKGFEEAFTGTRILVPRTISLGRLRASYTEADLTFQDIILGITVPDSDKERGKILTALLNSKIAVWYSFHGTASFGSERPEVKQSGVIHLPFPAVEDLPEPERAQRAAAKIITLMDREIAKAKAPFMMESGEASPLSEIDQLAYDYFCLSKDEIILIEDMVNCIIPAVQPHQGSFPGLWKVPTEAERREYATSLIDSIADWLQPGTQLYARLEAVNADLGVLRLSISGDDQSTSYAEETNVLVNASLSKIMQHIHQPVGGNFQLMPDLRLFIDKDLYLVKPMQRRFWLRSAALADADAIAGDLQQAIDIDARKVHAG